MGNQIGIQHRHHQPAVGIALIAGMLAHAIGDHTARFRGGTDHEATGAHAEAVDATAVAGVMHQLVFGSAKKRMTGTIAPTGPIDQRLRMLDAHADGKRLPFKRHPRLLQHGERIASRMPRGEHHLRAGKLTAIGHLQSPNPPWLAVIGSRAPEADAPHALRSAPPPLGLQSWPAGPARPLPA